MSEMSRVFVLDLENRETFYVAPLKNRERLCTFEQFKNAKIHKTAYI